MKYIFKAFQHYADFNGRASKKEFWMFMLFYVVCIVIVQIIIFTFFVSKEEIPGSLVSFFPIIVTMVLLAPPLYAVLVRRLHDTGRSGAAVLLAFVPLIGIVILLFYCLQDSQEENNKYGANPKTEHLIA